MYQVMIHFPTPSPEDGDYTGQTGVYAVRCAASRLSSPLPLPPVLPVSFHTPRLEHHHGVYGQQHRRSSPLGYRRSSAGKHIILQVNNTRLLLSKNLHNRNIICMPMFWARQILLRPERRGTLLFGFCNGYGLGRGRYSILNLRRAFAFVLQFFKMYG